MSQPSGDDLRLRKAMLIQRSAVQRQMLGVQTRQLVAPVVRTLGRVQASGQWVREHPALVAGVAAVFLAWRPRAVMGLVARGIGLWPTIRRVLPLALRLWTQWQHHERKPRS